MAQHWRPESAPVCPEPKVFVGQLPFESTTQDVQALFARYGTVRSCQVITGQDGRSKGCAMVLYAAWAEAEAAVEGENGTTHLGGSKPMVVKFADPPRRGDGPIVGIAPKKLFVGQIPSNSTEEMLRSMFAPFGNVLEVHLLMKGLGSGCGFVTFDRWASCEAAIAALHGKTQLEGAKMPVVVKFADAKVPLHDNGFGTGKRGPYDPNAVLSAAAITGAMVAKKTYGGIGGPPFPYAMGGYGMNMGIRGGHMGGMPTMGGYSMGMVGMGNMGMMGGMAMHQGGMGPGLRGVLGLGPGGGPKIPGAGNQAMQASKMGSGVVDEASKQWKLFVGQVPFEANEADLWGVFSSIGNIHELVILRTPQGKSKGCAFVTYETRDMAEKAIRQLDGQVALPEDPKQRLLIVKYAGPGGTATPPGAAAAALVSGADSSKEGAAAPAVAGGVAAAAAVAPGKAGATRAVPTPAPDRGCSGDDGGGAASGVTASRASVHTAQSPPLHLGVHLGGPADAASAAGATGAQQGLGAQGGS